MLDAVVATAVLFCFYALLAQQLLPVVVESVVEQWDAPSPFFGLDAELKDGHALFLARGLTFWTIGLACFGASVRPSLALFVSRIDPLSDFLGVPPPATLDFAYDLFAVWFTTLLLYELGGFWLTRRQFKLRDPGTLKNAFYSLSVLLLGFVVVLMYPGPALACMCVQAAGDVLLGISFVSFSAEQLWPDGCGDASVWARFLKYTGGVAAFSRLVQGMQKLLLLGVFTVSVWDGVLDDKGLMMAFYFYLAHIAPERRAYVSAAPAPRRDERGFLLEDQRQGLLMLTSPAAPSPALAIDDSTPDSSAKTRPRLANVSFWGRAGTDRTGRKSCRRRRSTRGGSRGCG